MTENITDVCKATAGWQEKRIDDTVPDEAKSDSHFDGDFWGKARSIRDLMDVLKFTRDQWEGLCTGSCTGNNKQCLPKGLESPDSDNIILTKKTMTLPDGRKRSMYWAIVITRPGTMKLKASSCHCVSNPWF
jgi:hypothetical protein